MAKTLATPIEVTVQMAIAPVPTAIAAIAPSQWQSWLNQWFGDITPVFALPPASGYTLTLRFCNDTEIQQLNQHYRQQDRPTDVLAFATLDNAFPGAIASTAPALPELEPLASEPTELELPEFELPEFELGDIIVSLPTAQAQAQEQGHTLHQEAIWLVSHGFLHLLGWDHPDAPQLQRMLQQQDQLLTQSQIKPPFWANYDKL